MVSLVFQHFIDLVAAPSGARAGGAATAHADRPCLCIVKRRVTCGPPQTGAFFYMHHWDHAARVPQPPVFVALSLLRLIAVKKSQWQIIDSSLRDFLFACCLHISAVICMFWTFSVVLFCAKRLWHSLNAVAEKRPKSL